MTNERARTATTTKTADETELNFSRVIDAPRALVFSVWTGPQHFAQWFAPHAVAIPFCRIDPRPGGELHFCHRLDDGMEVWVKGVYREVVVPQRLVFALGFVDAGGRPAAHPMFPDWPLDTVILTTVTFAELNGKTELTVRQVLEPALPAAVDAIKREREGAQVGWTETLERLETYIRAKTSAP
jgi:uncharacterized protein YndB with AHSA1/START domain